MITLHRQDTTVRLFAWLYQLCHCQCRLIYCDSSPLMLNLFNLLLAQSYYIPHGHCYLWQTPLVSLYIVSDALIAIAYFSIPAMLIYFVRKRSDIPFSKVFILFGAFIILCGLGHLFDIWTLWHPDYWLVGIERAATALVSCYTALQLVDLLPQFLALRMPEQLEALNQELETQVQERQRTEETLQMIVAGTASVIGKAFFPALVQNLATALDVAYVMLVEVPDHSSTNLRSLAVWADDRLVDNFDYDLAGSPCETVVLSKRSQNYPSNLQRLFPHMALLKELQVESYVGVPIVDHNQEVIGNLCVLDVKPYAPDDRTRALLSVFAARAATELQRQWAEEEKHYAYEQLELRVRERTTELSTANTTLESEVKERRAAETAIRLMAERERATTQVILQMRQSLELSLIFEATTAELRRVIQCDRVLIYQFKPDWSGEVVAESVAEGWKGLLAQQPQDPTLTQKTIEEPGCAIADDKTPAPLIEDTYLQATEGAIYRHKNSYRCVSDIYQTNFSPCYLQFLETLQARAYVIAPIFCGNQLWGLLAVYQNQGPRQWQAAEVQIATQISNQLGVAVQQAELFVRTQQQAEELRQAKEAADAASRAKTDFLANMSHELRTPLNAILGFTQLMQRDPSFPPQQKRYIEIINQSGEHLLGLINDVLEMSKIEAGRLSLYETEFSIYKLLHGLESMLQLKAQAKGLDLQFICDPAVSEFIKTDEKKLRQVLINLLGNAIKFTESGRVVLRVKSHPMHPERLTFEVEDTGPGIAAEEMGNLFQAFQQTQSGQQSKDGTGLGLRISQSFVELLGGGITVNSKLGQGSCFSFYIRFCPAESKAITAVSHLNKVIAIAPNQPQYRLLIVEDSPANRLLLSKILTQLGFEVREAENGQIGFELWQQWQPDFVFMDMHMPVLNGYETTRQIREWEQKFNAERSPQQQPRSTKIVAITASAFAEQRQNSMIAGCDDFISKPFQRGEIFETLTKYLGVQYLYESTPEASSFNPVNSALSLSLPTEGSPLAVMSTEWIAQLHDAAAQGNDFKALQLIAQIPQSHKTLSELLTQLIESYQFDRVMSLTQASPSLGI